MFQISTNYEYSTIIHSYMATNDIFENNSNGLLSDNLFCTILFSNLFEGR